MQLRSGGQFAVTRSLHAGCGGRSEEHTSELQSPCNLVCRLLLEKKKSVYRHIRSVVHTRCVTAVGSYIARASTCRWGRRLLKPTRNPVVTDASLFFFFFNDTATTEIYPLPLPEALPISALAPPGRCRPRAGRSPWAACRADRASRSEEHTSELQSPCNLVCRLLLEK